MAVIDIGYNSKYEKDMSGYYGGGFIEASLLPYRYLFKQQCTVGGIHVNRMERKINFIVDYPYRLRVIWWFSI